MKPYVVLDNLIPKSTQQRIYDIVTSGEFSWRIFQDSSYPEWVHVPDFYVTIPTISFIREVYSYGDLVTKELMPWCLQILDEALEREGLEMEKLERIQVNLLYGNVNKEYKKGMWTSAHVDQDHQHHVLLYYINDSDGDTVLFNERKGDEFQSFTEMARVQPKQGSAILFDGRYFHSASNPINNNKRLAINFNFILKDQNGKST
jgi:hypothetical protein